MKSITLHLHCPHLFVLAIKSHQPWKTGASFKSLTYASHIFSQQKRLVNSWPCTQSLAEEQPAWALAARTRVWVAKCWMQLFWHLLIEQPDVCCSLSHLRQLPALLLFSFLPVWEGKAPCLSASTKGHPSSPQTTRPPVGYFTCFQEHGQPPELSTVWATEEVHGLLYWALQQHRQGWKHGITDLRMLCNKTTRNLLSFMTRKKLWLRKMHWIPMFCRWLLVSVSIYIVLETITRPWTLRCAALRKCSTKEKNGWTV